MASFFPKQTVVVPVDFSEPSFKAVEVARTLVDSPASLRLVHVLPIMTPMDPGIVWESWTDESRKQHAREALKARVGTDFKEAQLEVLIGDPARAVAFFAADIKADLIVLPSHGRTGAARLLIGSVAERIVRHAHCPVLVLRE